jgi:tetratricopeptide (TPR) repeat protein
MNTGAALAESGNESEAIRLFRRALRADPSQIEARVNLASLYLRRPRMLTAAVALVREALAIDPDHASAHYEMTRCMMATGDKFTALRHLRSFIRIADAGDAFEGFDIEGARAFYVRLRSEIVIGGAA